MTIDSREVFVDNQRQSVSFRREIGSGLQSSMCDNDIHDIMASHHSNRSGSF